MRPEHTIEDRLALAGALAVLAGLVCAVVWLLTGAHAFWPAWVWLGLGTVVALAAFVRRTRARRPNALVVHAQSGSLVLAHCFCLWLLGGAGYFWPVWVMLGVGTTLAVHAVVRAQRDPAGERERLTARVDTLERTRRGALDVQSAELRRIERDLHDGAQARLLALSMRLGRAELRLEDDPEAARLVREAREDATAAIAELRDLARGIAPPVLADRGLVAATQALAERATVPAEVDAELPGRLPPVVESAAYFVVAEALTNVAKHAPGARALVRLRQADGALHVDVADDGPGGAVLTGSGLTGLAQRAHALDGDCTVTSPPGGGTRIAVVLPCGS